MNQAGSKWNDDRIDHLSGQVDFVRTQVDSLRHHMDARFERQEARIDAKFAALDGKFDALQRTIILTLGGIVASILATFGGVFLAAQL